MTEKQKIEITETAKAASRMATTLERQRILTSKLMQDEEGTEYKDEIYMGYEKGVRNDFRAKLRELLKGE